ncbi:MAG: CmpA/NrtA family ABC transporter substrate-binding protein [Cytophagales bacterium]|nr:CmpA/NrtA family ABC transporter substrate-binding protein [Cytophagales bacterium]
MKNDNTYTKSTSLKYYILLSKNTVPAKAPSLPKLHKQISIICFAIAIIFTSLDANAQGDPIKLGFIPLTDCTPLVIAKEKGFFAKYGVNVVLSKEASWANIRDKVLTGELDGAHCLFGMPFSVYTGVGGKEGSEMKVAMVINNNGQAITLTKDLCGIVGAKEYAKVPEGVKTLQAKKDVTFAMTFPGGTHDMWLRVWLAFVGVNMKSIGVITIPPPQMVANMRVDNMEGYCVGEPWNGVASAQNVGFTHCASQDIWKHHPEKALVVNKDFSEKRREDLKKVMKAIMEACQYADVMKNRKEVASIIADVRYVNAKAQLPVVEGRLMGKNDIGCDIGVMNYKDDYMLFYNNGFVNMPRKAHGIWFMTQYVRFGYLKSLPDNYKQIADNLIMEDLYAEVAKEMNVPMPTDEMKPFSIKMDPVTFDPNNPIDYLSKVKK